MKYYNPVTSLLVGGDAEKWQKEWGMRTARQIRVDVRNIQGISPLPSLLFDAFPIVLGK
tara:strand:+ start:2317 stop:2493 length:177 start_codon:yes stop_codon:yes gene_type:complete